MKNIIAYIFILTANLLLLAHAVIPHHHHIDNSLLVSTECSHEEEHTHHGVIPVCSEDQHDHETATCNLAQTVILPNNQTREIEDPVVLETSDFLFLSFYVFHASAPSIDSSAPPGVVVNTSLFSRLLVTSVGLRAPPVC